MAKSICLPVFQKKINTNSIFASDGEYVNVTKTMLTEGFVLENADSNIDFARANQEAVMIETKGDDRDNSDSRDKIEIGKYWANKSGDEYSYFMVFENAKLDNAISVQDLLKYLRQM